MRQASPPTRTTPEPQTSREAATAITFHRIRILPFLVALSPSSSRLPLHLLLSTTTITMIDSFTTSTAAQTPSVPPLYFADKNSGSPESPLSSLPAELVRHCLTGYADWGDLAKLATLKREWKNVMYDAAAHGGHEAAWELAQALLEGTHGLERNPRQAMTLLKQLAGVEMAEDGAVTTTAPKPFAPAMKCIADCYLTGNGVEAANAATGVCWLEAAFHVANDVEAAHKLALLHEYGENDVEIDVFVAADWFLNAAKGGHVEAMAEYAMCCELGCGREQSDEEALEWYTKAANEGHTTAKFSVGEAFEEARGVPQSDEEACLWYYKAAVEGDEDSKKALRRLEDIARIVLPGVMGILNA
jgi:TPR repeat protein